MTKNSRSAEIFKTQQQVSRPRPQNIGIIGIEVYFPPTYIDQRDLEVFDKVGEGKYTIGLGQKAMSYVQDCEDINSISLTALQNLLNNYSVDPRNIGRLEVGTETLLDKAKSMKTLLMSMFRECGNHDIEGATSINACYGSTNAIFNTLNWIESSSWDGRYGIVISSDIAVYPKGNARATGGAGAIAILFGPDAPIVFEPVRSTYSENCFDFFKPNPFSEYPTVNGHHSMQIFMKAMKQCFLTLRQKYATRYGNRNINLSDFSYFAFHTPFCKMVQKSFLALILADMEVNYAEAQADATKARYDMSLMEQFAVKKFINDAATLSLLLKQFKAQWVDQCERGLYLAQQLGNIYTGSLYNGLISYICDDSIDLTGKQMLMFSYGSGCAASMFILRFSADYHRIRQLSDPRPRLARRVRMSAQDYDRTMNERELSFGKANLTPNASIEHLDPGTFYLTRIDEKFVRYYAVKERAGQQVKELEGVSSPTLSMNQVAAQRA